MGRGNVQREMHRCQQINVWGLKEETWIELEIGFYLHTVGDNTKVTAKVTKENV